jgi:hypothetical protein
MLFSYGSPFVMTVISLHIYNCMLPFKNIELIFSVFIPCLSIDQYFIEKFLPYCYRFVKLFLLCLDYEPFPLNG